MHGQQNKKQVQTCSTIFILLRNFWFPYIALNYITFLPNLMLLDFNPLKSWFNAT